jgi:hypothetical protein
MDPKFLRNLRYVVSFATARCGPHQARLTRSSRARSFAKKHNNKTAEEN